MSFQITEVQIIPIKPNNGLVAFASCVLNNSLYVGSIAIHQKLDASGYRLTYPTKKIGNDNMHVYHPITKIASEAIETTILGHYVNLIS